MKHVLSRAILVTILCTFTACRLAHAAMSQSKKATHTSRAAVVAAQSLGYAFPDESHGWPGGGVVEKARIPTGTLTLNAAEASPGKTVGWTYYDYQHNASMGRMVDCGPHSGETGKTVVHFGWMHLPGPDYVSRTYMYNAYKSDGGILVGALPLHDPVHQYSGYVNIDVTPDNRALVGGHCDLMTGERHYMAQIHFDDGPAFEMFDTYVRVPDSLGAYLQDGDTEAMWPKFFLQLPSTTGQDTVLHVITMNWEYYGSVLYFRNIDPETTNDWDYPPYIVDSVQCMAHDLTGERQGGRVCLAWMAGLPYQDPDCDTCSGLTVYDTYLLGQMDNDVYVQISEDQGVTWQPRKNLTTVGIGEAGYKAYCDLSILYDQSSNLHVVWNAVPWPADTCIDGGLFCWDAEWTLPLEFDKNRIFHWSENVPYVRTICDATYTPSDSCGPPHFWNGQASKMSLSECNDRLYCMWSQFNDVPGGIIDDCALWGYEEEEWAGAANADIWVAVSEDGGLTWDRQRNLTNSYTPMCDPHEGEICQSDYWASMSRWGRQIQAGETWSGADVVDPSGGSSSSDWYLDIQYVNDLDAGGIGFGDEGSWVNDPIKWFRMKCVEPIPNPLFVSEWDRLDEPAYTKPGQQLDTTILFENIGNAPLGFTIDIHEDNGPTGGWISVSYVGTILPGMDNTETVGVAFNENGEITEAGRYTGRLIIEGNDPYNLPDTIEIDLLVADTLVGPYWDEVNTSSLTLAVSNHGNMGRNGTGGVNMDYYDEDCAVRVGFIYMYDGSPLVGRTFGDDTVFNWCIWGVSYLSEYGFRPQGGQVANKLCGAMKAEIVESGTFTTQDSTIAFEKIWVAPTTDTNFIVEYMRVWSRDGLAHDDVMLGEAVDWDVPWDYFRDDEDQEVSAVNSGGLDAARQLLYMQGYECPWDEDTCDIMNDERFAGESFVESYLNGSPRSTAPYSGFIGENDSLQTPEGFFHGKLYYDMAQPGLRASDSVKDLHSVFCFEDALDLGASDVYEVVTVLATIKQGTLSDLQTAIDDGIAWYSFMGGIDVFADGNANDSVDICEPCCGLMGDFTHDRVLAPSDIVGMINYAWKGGPPPFCPTELDVNGDWVPSPADITYLINYAWKGGPEPVACPGPLNPPPEP